MEQPESLSACPFCGYTLSQYDAVAVVGIHDKDRSCILHGFKVVGYNGPKAWNRRAGAGRASQDNGGKQLCSSAWLDALVEARRALLALSKHDTCKNDPMLGIEVDRATIRIEQRLRHEESASNEKLNHI